MVCGGETGGSISVDLSYWSCTLCRSRYVVSTFAYGTAIDGYECAVTTPNFAIFNGVFPPRHNKFSDFFFNTVTKIAMELLFGTS